MLNSGRLSSLMIAIAVPFFCVILLMWPALINRQPFFFADTTSYVRAADISAHLASGGRVSTAWTERYRTALKGPEAVTPPARHPTAAEIRPGNDVAAGSIMSGRSPYFGMLLYLSYLTSDFWLFVLVQAVIAFVLIRMSLDVIGQTRPIAIIASVGLLAALTSLPFYNSLLMADALTGFGIVAFLLLAVDRSRTAKERCFLVAVMLVSAASHLTHIVILLAMTVTLAGAVLVQRSSWPRYRFAIGAGAAVVLAGLASVWLTSVVVERTFKRPPQLVPLLTSRFIEDGPGAEFIRAGCDGGRFVVCSLPNNTGATAMDFLWSSDPKRGTFMLVDAATRQRLSAEDVHFALAVIAKYPVAVVGAMLRNTALQLADFHNGSLAEDCFDQASCWASLPAGERATLRRSVAGQNQWPIQALDALHYSVVFAALLIAAGAMAVSARSSTPALRDVRAWVYLTAVALITNAFLCGAVSIPQYRYEGRVIWLVPFLAGLLAVAVRRSRSNISPRGYAVASAPPVA